MPDCLDLENLKQGLSRSTESRCIWELLQSFFYKPPSSSGEPEVVPRDEPVQDVGRADEAPGLPGEHAGGQHEGESIIFVRILFLMRCVIRCASAF